MDIKTIGIVGAGNMGAGIAQKAAQEGFNVILLDIKDEFVDKGISNIKLTLEEGVERKIFSQKDAENILNKIKGTTHITEMKRADYIIEAIFEDKKIKKELFKELGKIVKDHAIIATNTSSFKVSELAESSGIPERFIGMHFFYHPAKNRLVEIIPGTKTSNKTEKISKKLSKSIAKIPIIVKDKSGFCVNRFFVPWLNESVRMAEENIADIPTIETAAKKAFRIGMGPFELMNVTGIPIAYHSTATLGKEFGEFYQPSQLLEKQFKSGNKWEFLGKPDGSKFDLVSNRLFGVIFQITTSIVEKGITTKEDVDIGAKTGLRWSMGPFEMMNRFGIEKTHKLVEELSTKYTDAKIPAILKKQYDKKIPWDIKYVLSNVENGVGAIKINRPDAMNALNETIVNQLEQEFDKLSKNKKVKGITIEGVGKAFVAGADIKFFIKNIENKTFKKTYDFTKQGQDLLLKIENSDKPVIVKLTGLSLGGGSELALSAKNIIWTDKSMLGFPETGIGIYPGLGGTQRLPKLIGKELAKYFIFTGSFIDSKTAEQLGMIDYKCSLSEVDNLAELLINSGKIKDKYERKEVTLPINFLKIEDYLTDENIKKYIFGEMESTDEDLLKLRKIIKRKAPIAIKIANMLIEEGYTKKVNEGIELELANLEKIFATKDAFEGLTSLGRKRPEFKGE